MPYMLSFVDGSQEFSFAQAQTFMAAIGQRKGYHTAFFDSNIIQIDTLHDTWNNVSTLASASASCCLYALLTIPTLYKSEKSN